MEEASIAAVNGELSPFTTGVTACRMIGACRDMTDYRRASEWIEATEKYCDRQSLSGFPGRLPDPPSRGRRRRRRLGAGGAGARAGDDRARRLQRHAAAGRRVLRDRRHPPAAAATSRAPSRPCARRTPAAGRPSRRSPSSASPRARSRRRRARSTPPSPRRRGIAGPAPGCCPAQVEIAIAAGDVAGRPNGGRCARARSSADYPSPAFEAGRQVALARVLLAEGDATGGDPGAARRDQGLARGRGAVRGRAGPGDPVARAAGASTTATTPTSSSKRRSRRSPSSGRGSTSRPPSASDGTWPTAAAGPRRRRKTFMFTDIVGSTSLAEALGDQAWEAVLR